MGRYCDSRCIYAVSDVCHCRCAGANHGVGRRPAPAIQTKVEKVVMVDQSVIDEMLREIRDGQIVH